MLGPSFDKAMQHHRAGELDKAVALYRHTLRTARAQDAVRVASALAAALQQMGELDQAEEALRHAVRAESPPAIATRRMLASFLSAQARMTDAVAVWAEAATGDAPPPEARLGLAIQLSEARRAEEALDILRRLARDQPAASAIPAVQYEHARLCERLGLRDEAAAALDRARALAPDLPEIDLLAARLDSAAGRLAEARARLERLAETLPESRRGVAFIELAQVHDLAGDFDSAFAMAARGQAANFAALPPHRRDGLLHERVIDACLQVTGEQVRDWSVPPPMESPPVFIVGFPRSGTTLIEHLLSRHDRFAVTDELPILQRIRERMFMRFQPRGQYPRDLGAFTPDQVAKARAWYLERAAQALGPALASRRIVDKQPLNTIDLVFVRRIFPESPVIFVRRDPRDTVLSCFLQGFSRGMPHLFSLEGTARLHVRFMEVWRHYRGVLGLKHLEVIYEDLARDPEAHLRRIVDALGESWDPRLTSPPATSTHRYITTPSYAQVTRPVHTQRIGRWQNYRAHLGPVLDILGAT